MNSVLIGKAQGMIVSFLLRRGLICAIQSDDSHCRFVVVALSSMLQIGCGYRFPVDEEQDSVLISLLAWSPALEFLSHRCDLSEICWPALGSSLSANLSGPLYD